MESGNGNGAVDPIHAAAEIRAAASIMLERIQFMRQAGITFHGMRDLYQILGYDRIILPRQYRDRYERGGIAKRVVDALPKATWRGGGELVENDDPQNPTPFETAWEKLNIQLRVWATLLKADILAGQGHYSVLLIGAPGELHDPLPKGQPGKLLYMTPFSEEDARIAEWCTDAKDPRFGLPNNYYLKRLSMNSPSSASPSFATPAFTSASFNTPVHWSRCIHICEGALDNDVYGPPALECVWNLLDDLEKVTGGGAEAFWLRAHQGLHLDVDKDFKLNDPAQKKAEMEELRKQAEEYQHQISRVIRTRGVTAEMLGSDVANFGPSADAILKQIAGAKGIPLRILTGSEMGQLASSQDRDNWVDQINGRQSGYAGPYIVRPLIDRLTEYGYLPTPSEPYQVRWPHMQVLTEAEKAEGATQWATVNKTQGKCVFTPEEIRDHWYSFEPLTQEEIEANTPVASGPPQPGGGLPAGPSARGNPDAMFVPNPRNPDASSFPKAAAGGYNLSSTQVELPEPIFSNILRFGSRISDEDLAPDGRETAPHITVKYGLHTNSVDAVLTALHEGQFGSVIITLGDLGYFPGDDHDVLYAKVISPDLVRLNTLLTSRLDTTNTTNFYVPHATIAYLRKGLGAKYVGKQFFAGQTAIIHKMTFSPVEGDKIEISLGVPKGLPFPSEPEILEGFDEKLVARLTTAIIANDTKTIDEIVGTQHA